MNKPNCIVDPDGTEGWWLNGGTLHREDGPAITYPNGTREWWRYGELHCKDGPAVTWPDGSYSWWVNGLNYSFSGWYIKSKLSLEEIVEMKLVYG